MQVPNKLIELDYNKQSDNKEVYILQKIIEYKDRTECIDAFVFDSCKENDEIYKALENLRRTEKQFCDYNKYIKNHTCTYRIVKVKMGADTIYSVSDKYENNHNWKTLQCNNCNGNIYYGDDVVIKGNKIYCCYDCLAEENDIEKLSSDDCEYDELFGDE